MAKKTNELYAMIKRDAQGNLFVRFVASINDGTHPFGEQTAELTNGEKNALNNLLDKIARKAEA